VSSGISSSFEKPQTGKVIMDLVIAGIPSSPRITLRCTEDLTPPNEPAEYEATAEGLKKYSV